MSNIKVVLDAGHGSHETTPGKRSPEPPPVGIYEGEQNRIHTAYLKECLTAWGIKTLDWGGSDMNIDNRARAEAANAVGAELYISLHMNAEEVDLSEHPDGWGTASGITVFYYPGSSRGREAAEAISAELAEGNLPDRGVKTAKFTVLKYTAMPAVLIELGFMTNREDVKEIQANYKRYLYSISEAVAALFDSRG